MASEQEFVVAVVVAVVSVEQLKPNSLAYIFCGSECLHSRGVYVMRSII